MTTRRKKHGNEAEAYRVFFEALKTDEIPAVVEAAWQFFGMPVLLTDENYRLICQYPQEKTGEIIWDTLFEKKVLPRETIIGYQEEYLKNKNLIYGPFYADKGLVGSCPRIFSEIFEGEKIYGHAAVFMFDEKMYPEDLKAMQVFTDALRILMIPHRRRMKASLSASLTDLLEPQTNSEVRMIASHSLESGLRGAFSLMVTPVGTDASQRAFATMVISEISDIYRATVSVVYGGCIVTLFGLMSGRGYSEKEKAFFERVSKYIAPASVSSGISQPYTNLLETAGRFQQAYTTARLTRKQFEFFDSLVPNQIFEFVSMNMNAGMFIDPLLPKLAEYDRKNKTEYFRTLMVYSLSLHDKDYSASALGIHRNTLLYRLNRIEELFHFAYEDPGKRLNIMNSFQLWNADKGELYMPGRRTEGTERKN